MDPFELPETLPTDLDGLSDLRTQAGDRIEAYRVIVTEGGDLSDEQLADLRAIVAATETIDNAISAVTEADEARRTEVANLLGGNDAAGDDTDEGDEPAEGGDTDGPTLDADKEVEPVAASAAKRNKTSFAGTGNRRPIRKVVKGDDAPANAIGWQMYESAPGFKSGVVGFSDIAAGIDSVRPGHRPRSGAATRGSFGSVPLARLTRNLKLVENSHDLVAAIEAATAEGNLVAPEFGTNGSLTAAGGWCAPSETLYDFCDVPVATDLVSLPEITISRGGVKWPVEPDLSEIFESFQFFFTEPELEATNPDGTPTAVKECVEVPCPDEFEELRLNAVGYCVESGILQDQGWPELIEWFLKSITQEHFRAISRRTILNMVNGSGAAKIIPANSQIAAGSAILNSIALMAVNLRIDKGLARAAVIEGIAPAYVHEMIRADLANQQGTDTKAVTDQQIDSWFSARNIRLQFVADWQTRENGKPGNLGTVVWPGTVDVLLYPAGTWFRSMSKVIELGTMYPKEQLQVNRYTRFFTEDAIAVGKRCDKSILVRIPTHTDGAYGAPRAVLNPAYPA